MIHPVVVFEALRITGRSARIKLTVIEIFHRPDEKKTWCGFEIKDIEEYSKRVWIIILPETNIGPEK